MRADRWAGWFRQMLLRESQIAASLRVHRSHLPESLSQRYESFLASSRKRREFLEHSLSACGERTSGWARLVGALGALSGRLTAWGGTRRLVAMDLDSVRRLERQYFDAYHENPPCELAFTLREVIGEIERERAALVDLVKPLFDSGDVPAAGARVPGESQSGSPGRGSAPVANDLEPRNGRPPVEGRSERRAPREMTRTEGRPG